MEKTQNIYNLLIIDESGSMSSIYEEALTGINETLNGIRRTQEQFPTQNHFVSIVTFEGYGMSAVKTRRDCVPIGRIRDLGGKDYCPGGCTPLYDAIGSAVTDLAEKVREGDGVLVTIITDGYENSSSEYSGTAVKRLVSMMRKKGWTFAYIGANQDSVEVAHSLDIRNAMDFDATPEGTIDMCFKLQKTQAKYAEVCAMAPKMAADMENIFVDALVMPKKEKKGKK